MLLAGLTGGIGSGKTAVSNLLAQRGAEIIDADIVAREVVAAGSEGLQMVVDEFGSRFILPNSELDRRGLGHLVFEDAAALAKLNAIVHPLVRRNVQNQVELFRLSDKIVIQVVPLLIESGQYETDVVIVVDCDVEVAVARMISTRGWSEAESRARIAAQIDRQARLAAADLVIDNSGSRAHLVDEVDRCWSALQAFASGV